MKTRQLQKKKYKKLADGRSGSAAGRKKPARTFNSEIGGLLIMSSGVLVGLSLYSNGMTGIFGDVIKILLRGMLGLPSYAIPFMIMISGLFCLFRRVDEEFRMRLIYGTVLMVLSAGLIHTAYMSSIRDTEIYSINDFLAIMGKYFMDAASYREIDGIKAFGLPEGGGIIGAVLSIPFLWVFRSAGTFIILYT